MKIKEVSTNNILEIMSWFKSKEELDIWAGPNFTYPFDFNSFKNDLNLNVLKSYVLLSTELELLGFGQYYLRLGRCHLGRLVINPSFRGRNIISNLVEQLINIGKLQLDVKECSLFVLANNESAVKAYRKLGFKISTYPEKISLDNCLYMVGE